MPRITFYTRANCHLCDSARYVLDRTIANRPDLEVTYVDIDSDSDGAIRARYNDHVPVIFINDREFARHRLDGKALLAELNRLAD